MEGLTGISAGDDCAAGWGPAAHPGFVQTLGFAGADAECYPFVKPTTRGAGRVPQRLAELLWCGKWWRPCSSLPPCALVGLGIAFTPGPGHGVSEVAMAVAWAEVWDVCWPGSHFASALSLDSHAVPHYQ